MGNDVKPLLANPEDTIYPPGWKDAEAKASLPDGKVLKIGPPWPDYIKSESGALPEYVFYNNGKWAPYDPNVKKDPPMDFKEEILLKLKFPPIRARIDIELIVDGNIVDLNRIPLPADTQIIDKRFQAKHKLALGRFAFNPLSCKGFRRFGLLAKSLCFAGD